MRQLSDPDLKIKEGKVEIKDKNGMSFTTYSTMQGGRLSFLIRCVDEDTWQAAGLQYKLLVSEKEGRQTTVKAAPGIIVDDIGPMEVTPAVLDRRGNVLTPAVMDNRFHVNVLVSPEVMAREDADGFRRWKLTAEAFMGGTDSTPNKREASKLLGGVELIDPTTISTQGRIWL